MEPGEARNSGKKRGTGGQSQVSLTNKTRRGLEAVLLGINFLREKYSVI